MRKNKGTGGHDIIRALNERIEDLNSDIREGLSDVMEDFDALRDVVRGKRDFDDDVIVDLYDTVLWLNASVESLMDDVAAMRELVDVRDGALCEGTCWDEDKSDRCSHCGGPVEW